ncbi:MAG: YitT family protein [Xanthomonadales bacterium]|nr:YitT family protein [Xanthomonadales bacterium]
MIKYIYITTGSLLLAIAIAFFLLPAQIVTGGTPGMGILIHLLFPITVGIAMLLINIPLIVIGIKFIDSGFAVRSVYSMVLTAVTVDLFGMYVAIPEIKSMLLSTLYGGIFAGIGVGLVLKGNASAGGTTIVAKIIANYSHFKPAQVLLFMDSMIILSIGLIFKDMEKILWSMISIYVTAQVIDRILTGSSSEKTINIVSTKLNEIAQAIRTEMNRDGTILTGQNLTGEQTKQILFVVIDARRINKLKELVLNIDKNALMVTMEASEMIGDSRIPRGLT